MVFNNIRFEHFLSKNGIVSLQREFLKLDDFNNPNKRALVEPIRNLTIERRVEYFYPDDPKLTSEIIEVKHFFKDFLIPSIQTLSDNYYSYVLKIAESSGVFTIEQRESFIKKYILNTRNYKLSIVKTNILDSTIVELITEQLDILESALDGFIENPYPQVKKKLQFNWIRTDVEIFFHYLLKNGEIADIKQADLGRIIDAVCECKETIESDKYVSITGSNKHLSDFKKTSRPEELAIERLEKIFNKDFFKK